jgi:hypothetical protein
LQNFFVDRIAANVESRNYKVKDIRKALPGDAPSLPLPNIALLMKTIEPFFGMHESAVFVTDSTRRRRWGTSLPEKLQW